ncbi:hypothetical protein [Paractinoplanes hotanensis]|uniref:Nuclear transport factor 2 family protein n=1 Tax=Paractinoplanes hotanensis TaxID=2906497 RepID=A0ABT0XUN5_9ACTN|nr:hypothetical protein [Actinoplanes hotanensis]MCM4077501.1 hypothetical protein [Actinoplanes hotanensis]
MTAELDAPTKRLLDAADANDTDAFPAGFTADGVVDDRVSRMTIRA